MNSELPTPEWCLSVGGRQTYGEPYTHRFYWNFNTPAGDSTHVLVAFGDGPDRPQDTRIRLGICGSTVRFNPTRADVLRLVAVLKGDYYGDDNAANSATS